MKKTLLKSALLSMLLIPTLFLSTPVGAQQGEPCTDCATAQQAADQKAAEISVAADDIQTLKGQIETDLNDIRESTNDLDPEFEQAIASLIESAGCDTETPYEDITPQVDGMKGHLYDAVFYCPDISSLETFITTGFPDSMVQWSTSYDAQNTAAWDSLSLKFLELDDSLDDYFALQVEYAGLLEAAQNCVATMIERQENGECTETEIVHEEEDVPEEDEEVVDCPDCTELTDEIEAVNTQMAAIAEQMEQKSTQIAAINESSPDEEFEDDLEEAIASANCSTGQAFADIEVGPGQAAGVIYGIVFYCQNESDIEALIAALDAFWETHEVPTGDEDITEQVNTLLAEIETLQDEYNQLAVEKAALLEQQEECHDLLLSLREAGHCPAETTEEEDGTESEEGDTEEESENDDDDDDTADSEEDGEEAEAPADVVTIPAQKRRSASGGSSKSLNYCDYALFTDITPAPNTMTAMLETITFTAKSTINVNSMQLTVAGQALEMKAVKKEDGSYAVSAMLPNAITKDGKYRVELFGKDSTSPVCSRQRLHTIQVNSKIGTVVDDPTTPEDEAAEAPQEGELFSEEIDFTDIKNHWAREYILQLAQRGIVDGYGDGRFGPDNNITRAELTKIAMNTFAIGKMDVQTNPFPDVEAVQWYAPFIAQAKALAIVSGYNDGTFKPNNSVTRGEGLKILIEAAGIDVTPHAGVASNFNDVETDAFYNGYINWAVSKGIVSGYGDGRFGPNNTLTRGELAKIAMNMLNFLNR